MKTLKLAFASFLIYIYLMEILKENENFIVINKPAGISVHPDGKSNQETVSDWFVKEYPEAEGVGESLTILDQEIPRHGVVHRLDKETSGVMILAKNQETFDHLKEQFKNKEVKKVYHAFIYGNIKDERGLIDRKIGREKGGVRRWTTGKMARGELREAFTNYRVLKRGKNDGESYCMLEVYPKTGRTHQIRVHMKSIGHPVVADSLYAPNHPKILGFDRLALHARKIVFSDINGEVVEVEAPYTDDFNSAILLD